jgi:hypothetical protein
MMRNGTKKGTKSQQPFTKKSTSHDLFVVNILLQMTTFHDPNIFFFFIANEFPRGAGAPEYADHRDRNYLPTTSSVRTPLHQHIPNFICSAHHPNPLTYKLSRNKQTIPHPAFYIAHITHQAPPSPTQTPFCTRFILHPQPSRN